MPMPLLTADTPVGGTTGGAPWPFFTVPQQQQLPQQQLQQMRPAPQRPSSILPQTLDAWIAGGGRSSADLRIRTPTSTGAGRAGYF